VSCIAVCTGVSGASGRCNCRRCGWDQYWCRTAAAYIVVIGCCRRWCDGVADDRPRPDDTAAVGAGTARSQVPETRTAAFTAAAADERCGFCGFVDTGTGAMHAAQLCQHEERAQAHDRLSSRQDMHW